MEVTVLGVAHIAATLPRVRRELEKLELDSSVAVFLEPRRSLLTGEEQYAHPAVGDFFSEILGFAESKGAYVVPLNPHVMPSHDDVILYSKYAKQFAEEEYMAEVIGAADAERVVVLIGAIHAERLARLLRERGFDARHRYAVPLLPENVVALSWRESLEGRSAHYLPLQWLRMVEHQIRREMGLPRHLPTKEICWTDERALERYVTIARGVVERFPPHEYAMPIGQMIQEMAGEVQKESSNLLESLRDLAQHAGVAFALPSSE